MRPLNLQAGWRGLVPLVVGGTVALVVAGTLTAGASDLLPPRSATQLLADLDRVHVAGYSGTVVQKSTLLDASMLPVDGLSLARLMSGSNTIKVWYGGPDRQRIAVLDATGESDVFRNGKQVWQWDSNTRVATQSVGSSTVTAAVGIPVDGTTVTPDDLARKTVAAIGPGTDVSVSAQTTVAGRAAYQLVIDPPASSSTRIGRVVLALDGETSMPLAAQVYPRGITRAPAIDLSFQHIAFQVPDDDAFDFTPPPTATIRAYASSGGDAATSNPDPLLGSLRTTTRGSGWTRVAVIVSPELVASRGAAATNQFGSLLTPVSGNWGTGALLQTRNGLLSMLFVSDGRIVVGSVAPAELYAALG